MDSVDSVVGTRWARAGHSSETTICAATVEVAIGAPVEVHLSRGSHHLCIPPTRRFRTGSTSTLASQGVSLNSVYLCSSKSGCPQAVNGNWMCASYIEGKVGSVSNAVN